MYYFLFRVLEKDVTETITFDGSELVIEVDNSRGIRGRFTLCVKTTDQVASLDCPTGYDQIQFPLGPNYVVKTAKMDRQGKVMLESLQYTEIPSILFKENESLDVILQEVPDQSTKVTLLNAIRYVPPEPVEATSLKKTNSMAAFSVVIIVLLLIAGLLIVGLIATICCCRRRTPEKIKSSNDQSQKHETTSAIKDECSSAPLPLKLKSRRTSSTTVTTKTLPVKSSSAVAVFPVQNIQS
uniref:Cadherin domain-containing protein n=1 Tax=Panagrellus redivivus TaxID=6233 RepID=A0A7E4VXT8_PANRE